MEMWMALVRFWFPMVWFLVRTGSFESDSHARTEPNGKTGPAPVRNWFQSNLKRFRSVSKTTNFNPGLHFPEFFRCDLLRTQVLASFSNKWGLQQYSGLNGSWRPWWFSRLPKTHNSAEKKNQNSDDGANRKFGFSFNSESWHKFSGLVFLVSD